MCFNFLSISTEAGIVVFSGKSITIIVVARKIFVKTSTFMKIPSGSHDINAMFTFFLYTFFSRLKYVFPVSYAGNRRPKNYFNRSTCQLATHKRWKNLKGGMSKCLMHVRKASASGNCVRRAEVVKMSRVPEAFREYGRFRYWFSVSDSVARSCSKAFY